VGSKKEKFDPDQQLNNFLKLIRNPSGEYFLLRKLGWLGNFC
jgi:hypothetical protein